MNNSNSIGNNVSQEEKTKLDDDKVIWNSCCFNLNKNFVKFSVQVFISLIILALSCYKLIIIDSSEDKSTYISLITLILGVYCPSPSPH